MIQVLLADDHALVRQGLRAILMADQIDVVAEANSGVRAVDLTSKLLPHVVVMDVGMRDLNGIEATRRIRTAHPDVRVIGLSMYSAPDCILGMLDAGASGYVLKAESYQELRSAVHSAARGLIHLSPLIAQVVKDRLRLDPGQARIRALGAREREVVQLLAEGHSSASIAEKLGISFHTVETHRRNIMRKLDIHSVAELTRYALRKGLTTLD